MSEGIYVEMGFEPVAGVFRAQLIQGLHFGAQLYVSIRGRPALDLWGGSGDRAGRIPVRGNTPAMVFSATKAFTSASIHKLADQGLLDMERPAAEYWPEFGSQEK